MQIIEQFDCVILWIGAIDCDVFWFVDQNAVPSAAFLQGLHKVSRRVVVSLALFHVNKDSRTVEFGWLVHSAAQSELSGFGHRAVLSENYFRLLHKNSFDCVGGLQLQIPRRLGQLILKPLREILDFVHSVIRESRLI